MTRLPVCLLFASSEPHLLTTRNCGGRVVDKLLIAFRPRSRLLCTNVLSQRQGCQSIAGRLLTKHFDAVLEVLFTSIDVYIQNGYLNLYILSSEQNLYLIWCIIFICTIEGHSKLILSQHISAVFISLMFIAFYL